MKKEEFALLGISEELAGKAEEASQKELEGYIPKAENAAVVQAKEQLEKDLKDRDKQLENLKKKNTGNEELEKQIESLQEENKTAKTQYEADMKELKLSTAIKLAVAGTAQDMDIVAGLVDKSKLVLLDDGKVSGLDEQIKAMKESKPFLFKADDTGGKEGGNTGKDASGKSGYNPRSGSTNETSVGKSIAESLNKADTQTDNPYAKAWG